MQPVAALLVGPLLVGPLSVSPLLVALGLLIGIPRPCVWPAEFEATQRTFWALKIRRSESQSRCARAPPRQALEVLRQALEVLRRATAELRLATVLREVLREAPREAPLAGAAAVVAHLPRTSTAGKTVSLLGSFLRHGF